MKELSYTTQMSLRSTEKLDATKVVQDITLGISSRGRKYRKKLKFISESTLSYDAAVSLIVEQK